MSPHLQWNRVEEVFSFLAAFITFCETCEHSKRVTAACQIAGEAIEEGDEGEVEEDAEKRDNAQRFDIFALDNRIDSL